VQLVAARLPVCRARLARGAQLVASPHRLRQRRWKVETSTGIAWRAGSHFAPKLPRDLPLFHLGDFNRDGKPDLVVVGENDAQVSVLLNNTP